MILRRLMRAASALLIGLLLVLGGLEAGLRVAPDLVPLFLLERFQKDVRADIAQQLGLTNASQVRLLERDDGGPPLYIMKPFTKVSFEMQGSAEKHERTSDSWGFCNPESVDQKPSADIVTVGDSFTVCWGPDPTQGWAAQLGALTGATVYNMGQGGIGPYDYVQILKQLGVGRHPKLVIMNIYEGNDLRDSVRYREHVDAAARGETLFESAGNRDKGMGWVLDNPLGRNSYAYNLAVVGVDRAISGLVGALKLSDNDVDFHYRLRFPDTTVEFNVENRDQGEVVFARRLRSGEISPAVFDRALEGFATQARQHGFQPLVIYSPAAYTAYADYTEFNDPALKALMGEFSRKLRSYLAAKTGELGLPFADMTPVLQAAARDSQGKELLYSPQDVHYLRLGHLVVAREVDRLINTSGWLPHGQATQ
jgi:hypothetical protein